jgi:hypothetical protein
MAILNYTTSIKCEKTLMEIQQCLVKHGATKIVTDYNNQIPIAVTFCLTINDKLIAYSLPANYKGVLNSMKKDHKVPRKLVTDEQALRVSWRIIKDWVEAQCAIVDAQLADVAEVFLPYAVAKSGKTLYNEIKDGGMKMLMEG